MLEISQCAFEDKSFPPSHSCKCVIEWQGERRGFRYGTVISRCEACVAKAKQCEDRDIRHNIHVRTHLEALTCEECGTHIGWAYENDLNGSHFFCNSCKEKFNESNSNSNIPT